MRATRIPLSELVSLIYSWRDTEWSTRSPTLILEDAHFQTPPEAGFGGPGHHRSILHPFLTQADTRAVACLLGVLANELKLLRKKSV